MDPAGEGPFKKLYTGDWNADEETYRAAVQGAAEWMLRRSLVQGGYVSAARTMKIGRIRGSAGVSVSWTMTEGFATAVGVGGGVGRRIRDPRTGQFQSGQAGIGAGVGYSEEEGWGTQAGAYGSGTQNGPKIKGGGIVSLTSEGATLGLQYGPISVGLILGLPPDFIDWLSEESTPETTESEEDKKKK